MTENFDPEIEQAPAEKPLNSGIGGFRAAWSGAWGGMLLFAGLFAFCLYAYAGFTVFDVENENIERIIRDDYQTHILIYQAKILAAYLVVGAVLGGFFGFTAGAFRKKEKRAGRAACFFTGLFGALLTQILMLLYGLAMTPGLYSKYFYDNGPPFSAIQRLASSVLTPPITGVLLAFVFFTALQRVFKRISPRFGTYVLGALALTAVVGGYAYCKLRPVPQFPVLQSRPNVLWLAADSIRPDHLGFFGHDRDTSPNIDKIASEGFAFTQAYTPLPRTFPSWATMLTGQYPHRHGIRNMFPDPKDTVLKSSIAYAFKNKGYRTAVVADYAGDIFPRMTAGFDTVIAPDFFFETLIDTSALQLHFMLLPYLDNRWARKVFPIIDAFADNTDSSVVTDRLIRTLDAEPGKPFFVAAFYSPTHFPFAPRYPYYKRYTDSNYKGPYKYRKPPDLSLEAIDDADAEQIRGLFDGAIRSFDDQIGRIVKALEKRGALENTIILITSDHGENLYDNNQDLGHGDHFRGNYSLEVPLIFHWPQALGELGKNGRRGKIDGLTSHLDIAPTLVNALDLPSVAAMDGVDLSPLVLGSADSVRGRVFAETGIWFVQWKADYFKNRRILYPDISTIGRIEPETGNITIRPEYKDIINIAKHRMVFDGRLKLISIPTPRGVVYECYAPKDDPGESINLYGDDHPECLLLRDFLLDWMAQAPNTEILDGYALPIN